jgi:uncharacterized protein YndB with AHSA1/START domain
MQMDTAPHVEVRVRRRFSAPAERVFNAWIDPATAGKWLFATAWRPMSRVKIDARAGGLFRFEDGRNGEDVVQTGKYVEIVRPRRLVFALAEEKRPRDMNRVSVEIVPLDEGCELTLVHESVLPDNANRTEGRWTGMLYGLAGLLQEKPHRQGRQGREDNNKVSDPEESLISRSQRRQAGEH